jgi:RNA methyltransferase, TrmH family
MSVVTSRQHPMVKQCRAILRGADTRLLIDGWHLLGDALGAGLPIAWVAVATNHAATERGVLDRAAAAGARVVEVTGEVLDAMSPVRSASGVVAVGDRPGVDPRALLAPAPALVLAALGVQDPGNVGALVRSADAAGATGVLLDEQAADPWSWKALRASMGSTFRLPVRREASALDHLRAWQGNGLRVIAADSRDGVPMYDLALTGPLVLVLGGEGAGLPASVLAMSDARVRVPMRPRVESLNVAVAAALLVYEAARQRA